MMLKRSTQFLHRACGAVMEGLEPRTLFSRALGIDVSHYQGTINWTSVKAAKDFAFIKATGSDAGDYTDSKYSTNFTNATSAGMLFGVYHFADPNSATSAVAQADFFYSKAASAMTAGHLPPVLDLETGSTNSTTISNWTNAFCNELYAKSGVKPLIYASSGTYASYVNSTVTSKWQLWVANYGTSNGSYTDTSAAVQTGGGPSNGSWPSGSWKFWQYNSVGSVSGISGAVDSDVFHGDTTALQSMVITAPEVTVTQSATSIADGQASAIDFGTANTGTTKTLTFTVKNDGGSLLTLGSVSATGGFSVADQLVSSLLPGATDTFTIQMPTSTSGTKSGAISFSNNDSNENPFNFNVTGTVVDATPPAPTSFAASDGLFQDHVALSWSAATGAAKYQLYRNTTNDPASATTLAQPTGTSYDDFTATANTTYYYWAATIDGSNVTGNKGTVDSGYADTSAPSVNSRNFQSQFGPAYISFTFSEPVGSSINAGDLQIDSVDSFAATVPVVSSVQWIAASNTAKFFLQTPLADGNFHATLSNVHDAASNNLGAGGSMDFHFLTGDANADRTVNALDFNALASHFGFAGAGFAGGDFDLSGTVDSADFTALATKWNETLPAAPSQPLGAALVPANLFATAEMKDAASDPSLLV